MDRMRQFFSLAGLTATETLRQPLVLLLTTACVVLTATVPLVLLHHFGEDAKVVRDGGLAFQFVFGLLIASYAACASLTAEVHSGTVATVLSKPVGRTIFFLAKFVGLTIVLLAFSLCAGLATLLSERVAERWTYTAHASGEIIDWQTGTLLLLAVPAAFLVAGIVNYRTHRPFGSNAFLYMLIALGLVLLIAAGFDRTGHRASFDFRVNWHIAPAVLLIFMALAVLAALALGVATRLGTAPTMATCGAIFLLGLLADAWLARVDPHSGLSAMLYALIPNWQHFWVADHLSADRGPASHYLPRVALYALSMTTGLLALGAASFRRVDI